MKKSIIILWLILAISLLGFQALVKARMDLVRPDYALPWTPSNTAPHTLDGRQYLFEPFMNNQVAWDSEYYLSIAVKGYNDQKAPFAFIDGKIISLNYAFLPLYPMMMRYLSIPFKLLGLNAIAAATLAGVLLTLLGALAGMLALYYLSKPELGEEGGLRTAFYLFIFPTGFFLAQVYTEGLFIGLAFSCLALIRYRKFGWAVLCAALATLTRAAGIALLLPLAWAWFESISRREHKFHPQIKDFIYVLLLLIPLLTFIIWKLSPLGKNFDIVESNFFRRHLFDLNGTWLRWNVAYQAFLGPNLQSKSYYILEFASLILGFIACIATFRRYKGVSMFSFLVLAVSLTSGPAQGMPRYILTAPSVFLFLSTLGKNKVFDKSWTMISILLMGLMATLFTFNMWAG